MSWAGIYENTYPNRYISATIGSAGTAQGNIGPCPEGFCWYVERLCCYSNTSATSGVLEIYAIPTETVPNDASKSGRQDVAVGTTVQNGVSDQRSPIFVGAGMFLVASWSGLTNGDLVRLSAQIRVHRLLATEPTGRHPGGSWWGTEAFDDEVKAVVVGDQVDTVGETGSPI